MSNRKDQDAAEIGLRSALVGGATCGYFARAIYDYEMFYRTRRFNNNWRDLLASTALGSLAAGGLWMLAWLFESHSPNLDEHLKTETLIKELAGESHLVRLQRRRNAESASMLEHR